ncbi:MAG: peptidoglycan-binding domain-containing protein [bacterium]|nr:peptidoglycan-binding domain-containing protein [bacterium]
MRLFYVSLFSVILAYSVLVIPVSAETFNTNLTIGSTGTDVVALQTYLVNNGYLVMPAGVSKGYFGNLTRAAVARWQAANGITPAVGYFGPISRRTIATEMETVVATPPSSEFFPSVETDTPSALGMRANQIMLFRAFPFEVRPGDLIALDGSGFSKTLNKIYFNNNNPVTATSTDGVTLKIPVPITLTNGEYKLSVSNVWGSSDNPDIKVIIRITSNPQPGPIIESASIVGDIVTLVGRGFTSANNLITTLGNSSSPISSDGTTLTFRITDLSMYSEIRQFTLGKYQEALWIYVQNEHGVNKEPYKLDITI